MPISSLESVPMSVTPVAMVADAYVAHQALLLGCLLGRYGECQWSVGVYYHATVAVGLLHIVVAGFDVGCAATTLHQFGVVLYGWQVG